MKTDNTYFADKIALRIGHLPGTAGPLRVLDAFAGSGRIWAEIEKRTGRQIARLSIDKKPGADIRGDNIRILRALDLSRFDVIDLDAYGVPVAQLRAVFAGGFRGMLFLTVVFSQFGAVPNDLLSALGYPPAMLRKIRTMFDRNGPQKFLDWLALQGVSRAWIRSNPHRQHNYLAITLSQLGPPESSKSPTNPHVFQGREALLRPKSRNPQKPQ